MKRAIGYFYLSLFFLVVSCSREQDPTSSDLDTDTVTNSDGDTDTDTNTNSDGDTDTVTGSGGDTSSDTDVEPTIDFSYLWHTFYYGEAFDIAEFDDGAMVVVGITDREWQGPAGQAPLSGFVEYNDLSVLKLDPSGEYEWHTILGDTGPEWGHSVVVDNAGDVVIGGKAGAAFDGPEGESPKYPYSGDYDNFVLKLTADGEYLWHAFFGADDSEESGIVALSGDGNIYVAGTSSSPWIVEGCKEPLNPHHGSHDVYLAKLDTNGECLWHTFHGGYADEQLDAISLDSSGAVYLSGGACDQPGQYWNGPDGQAPLNPPSFRSEGFALKLDSEGSYQWHTYFGGRRSERAYSLAAADDGVYIAGTTIWPWNGPNAELPITSSSQTFDAFVIKLGSDGAYRWHGFYGGRVRDDGLAIAVSESGVYVAGNSEGPWAGPEGQFAVNEYAYDRDGFVMNLGSGGAFRWLSFHGGSYYDTSAGLLMSSDGSIKVIGTAMGAWKNFNGQAPLNAHSGNWDFYILSLLDSSTGLDNDAEADQNAELGAWACHPAFFGANDGCDCGCEVSDPDCGDAGCEPGGCYDEGCFYCHHGGGRHMPCVPPGPGNICPTGPFDIFLYYGEIVCTTSEACANPSTVSAIGIEFDYTCPKTGAVCCVQFCEI